jgi:plastocyanin domain-containing protein
MSSNISVQKASAQMNTQQSPSRGTMGSGANYNKPLPIYLKANVTINGFNLIADVQTTN